MWPYQNDVDIWGLFAIRSTCTKSLWTFSLDLIGIKRPYLCNSCLLHSTRIMHTFPMIWLMRGNSLNIYLMWIYWLMKSEFIFDCNEITFYFPLDWNLRLMLVDLLFFFIVIGIWILLYFECMLNLYTILVWFLLMN